jgi:cell fate regulator YaaT (PSP1 superfamily)
MTRIVSLKFQRAGRHYDFNALELNLHFGDKVIVETERGRTMATVVVEPREVGDSDLPEGLKNILRLATEEDLALAEANAAREQEAYAFCLECINKRELEMKLVRAEYAFDGSKIIFYFTADGRIDFRELVKDLAHYFHTRIEMRQIGVRDEAKLVGGLGVCGRELCCCSFLTQFNPVSVKMAKEQGLALNPTKISGQCGRLLCCLGYEFDTYKALKKGMPKCGKKISWQDHECEVLSIDVLRQKITLRNQEGSCDCVTLKEFQNGRQEAPSDMNKKATENVASPSVGGSEKGLKKDIPATISDDLQPQKPTQNDQQLKKTSQNDGNSPKKPRRRGRRRPRSSRKPDNKQ